jgi:hypothetical protein
MSSNFIGKKGIVTHFAPDADAVLATALLLLATDRNRSRQLRNNIILVPSGPLPKEYQHPEDWIIIDVGGASVSPFDHHGLDGDKVSSMELMARHLGWDQKPWLRPLLDWLNRQDQQGINLRIQGKNGAQEFSAEDLLITAVMRGASNIRWSPFKVSMAEQIMSFRQLILLAQFMIRHFQRVEGNGFTPSAEATRLLQYSLAQAIAQDSHLLMPELEEFVSLADCINQLNRQMNDGEESGEAFDFFTQPGSMDCLRLVASPDLLVKEQYPGDRELARNISLIGIAQELERDRNLPGPRKVKILADAWQSILAIKADWLLAKNEVKNGKVVRHQIGKRLVAMVRSDCYASSKALRNCCNGNPQKADVQIIIFSTGHVRITCNNRDSELQRKMPKVAYLIRREEAKARKTNLPTARLRAVNELVLDWHLTDFGGLFNGTLTNPVVEPTKLTPERIFQLVCEGLR